MGWFDDLVDVGKDWGHTALDVVGMVPVIGNIADLANAGWYLAEGDKEMAALSAAAAIPGAGLAVGGGKLALGAGRAAKKADVAYKAAMPGFRPTLAAKGFKTAQSALSTAARTGKAASQFAATPLTRRFIGATTTPGKLGRFIGGASGWGKTFNVALGLSGLTPAMRRDAAIQQWRGLTPEEKEEHDSKKAYLKKVEDDYEFQKEGRDEFDALSAEQKEKYKDIKGYLVYKKAKEQFDALPAEEQAQYDSFDDYIKQQVAANNEQQPKEETAPLLSGDEPPSTPTKKGKTGKSREGRRERRRERRDFEESQRRFDKRMALKEARLGRKEERKAATVIDEKHALADEMLNSMGNEPDFFKNNPIEKGLYWKRARKLGVTADQFNNYINRNYKEGQRLYKQREYERESAEGRAWLNEKLDQPSLGQMGVPTPSARGRNIGRFKTGEVSPTKTEVRESVRESEEDERKKQRSRDKGVRKIEGRRDKKRGRGRDEERNPRRKLRSARR